MGELTFEYPVWMLGLCVLAGLVYALLLYFRDRSFVNAPSWLPWLLGTLRFLAVAGIAAFLLSPLLKRSKIDTQAPIVVVAQDASESVSAEMSPEALADYQQRLTQLTNQLGEQYDVKTYSFGENVQEGLVDTFDQKVTDMSALMSTIYDQYSNQNLGAIVMASDGIYNQGSNPLYGSNQMPVPVFAIGLGDTIPKKDLIVQRVFHNRIAYLGDKFTIQVDVSARNCAGANTNLSLYRVNGDGSQRLQSEAVAVDRNDFFRTFELTLEADAVGVQRYRLALGRVDGEVSTQNNSKDIFIDVLDARQKILIVANAPHPDLSALKQMVDGNKNYEATVTYADRQTENLRDYDFVILHQLPSKTNNIQALLSQLNRLNLPRWFILGSQSDINAFNGAQGLLSIQWDGRNTNDVQAIVAQDFNLFTLSDELRGELPTFAPVLAPFGEYKVAEGQTMLYQRIGKVDTQYPLLVLGESNGIKTGVFTAENLWKWRLFDFLQHQNHELFDEVFGKTVQYIGVKEDKRKFRVSVDKNIFDENESIVFDAELYNDNFERINDPDVTMVITSSDGKDYNYTFNKTREAYQLNAGQLPVGNYRYRGKTFSAGQELTHGGQFSIQPIQLESYATTADHGLLRLLSNQYGGQLLYPDQLDQLPALIEDSGLVKPVLYETTQTRPLLHLKWPFFILLGLLSLEWFLRRYHGAY